jgi:hypothetical protein
VNTIRFFINKNCWEACDPMVLEHKPAGAGEFELQMFLVDIGNGRKSWYGRLQNVNDEKKHYIKGWSGLVADLQKILTPSAQLKVLNALLPIKDRYIADILRGNL